MNGSDVDPVPADAVDEVVAELDDTDTPAGLHQRPAIERRVVDQNLGPAGSDQIRRDLLDRLGREPRHRDTRHGRRRRRDDGGVFADAGQFDLCLFVHAAHASGAV